MTKDQVDQMTLQQAMDYAVAKIVEQGGRCIDSDGGCAYGNEKGQHCVVGWLLDETVNALMGFVGGVVDLTYQFPYSVPALIQNNSAAFEYLQDLHDGANACFLWPLAALNEKGINTSAAHWEQWIAIRQQQEN
jgi:hypothetical protein